MDKSLAIETTILAAEGLLRHIYTIDESQLSIDDVLLDPAPVDVGMDPRDAQADSLCGIRVVSEVLLGRSGVGLSSTRHDVLCVEGKVFCVFETVGLFCWRVNSLNFSQTKNFNFTKKSKFLSSEKPGSPINFIIKVKITYILFRL